MTPMRKLTRFFFVLSVLTATPFIRANEKPNVLFLVVDDLKPLLGCYGDDTVHTPNIDRLAASGITFTNAHTNQAVCGPSRCSFFTSLRPDRTGVHDLNTDFLGVSPWAVTLPEHFIANGYATAGAGKLFHGGKSDGIMEKRAWQTHTDDENLPFVGDFPPPALFYQGKEQQDALKSAPTQGGKPLTYGKIKQLLKSKELSPSTEMLDIPDEAYTDGALRVEALKYLDQLGKGEQPFFVAVGFRKPHLPFVAPKKYWDLYDRAKLPLANFKNPPSGAPQFALHSWGELRNYSDISSEGPLPEEKQRELVHGYRACVSYIDAQIGLLLDGLRERDLEKNTIVVLFGDHGWHLGDHGLWCKHSNYEQATRTPLIFSGPGITPGTETHSPTELIDVYPSLCELTGTPAPENVDGISLVSLFSNPDQPIREVAVSTYPRHSDRMGFAFRGERFRYVVWVKNEDLSSPLEKLGKIEAEELYDYKTDPAETTNLAGEAGHAERITSFRQIARRHLRKQTERIQRHKDAIQNG